MGPCQQVDHNYPQKKIGGANRSFQKSWFKKHNWLEYSVAKNAAFCFYCF
uniref:TTF-type domain-containing protein n=1 Tax=Oryza brachyantha TaxID=4533 RepID=J3ND22_ORYBR